MLSVFMFNKKRLKSFKKKCYNCFEVKW